MKASRKRPKGAFRRPFGLVLCVVTAMPNSIGHQDLAALIARQPAVTERWRAHVRNSTFGTIHAASLSFPRPIGSSIPDPFFTQLAALDPRALEATGSIPLNVPIEPLIAQPTYDFPVVERRLKGDRLNVTAPAQPEPVRPDAPSKTKDMVSRPPARPRRTDRRSLRRMRSPLNRPCRRAIVSRPRRKSPKRLPRESIAVQGLPPDRTRRRSAFSASARVSLLVIAAPVEPVADKVLRRAGIAPGQDTHGQAHARCRSASADGDRGTGRAGCGQGAAPGGHRPRAGHAGEAHSRCWSASADGDCGTGRAGRGQGAAPGGDRAGAGHEAKRILGVGPRQPVVIAAPAEPVADQVLRRAGIAPGQDTQAKRILGIGPRQPVVIAAPAEPVADKVLRRAGIAPGQDTQAKRILGVGPRQPVVIAAPAEPVADKVLRRAGIAPGQDTRRSAFSVSARVSRW